MPPVLGQTLATAAREGSSPRIELGPLDPAEAARLVPATLPQADLYREAGGNPFYLEQLVRGAAREPGKAWPELSEVPPAVASALAGELASLSVPTRTLLEAAAIAGDPFDDWLVAVVAEVREAEALDGLDELIERDLVRPTSVPRRLTFRHPILRRAIYKGTGSGWRVGAHARAAAHLRLKGTAASALAHHVDRSASWGDEDAVALLIEAGDTTAPRAPATAAHWYQAALRLLPDGPAHESLRLQLLVEVATNLGTAGRLEESRTALCGALERLPPGAEGRTDLVAFCAGVETLLGRHGDSRARLLGALADAGEESVTAAALNAELGLAASLRNDYRETRLAGEKAMAVSARLGHRPIQTMATALVAHAQFYLGHTADAQRRLDEARSLFDGLDDNSLSQRLDAAFVLGWIEGCMERFDDAIRHCDRAIAVSRATGQGHYIVSVMIAKTWALTWSGRLQTALEWATAAVEAARGGHVQWYATGLWVLCFVGMHLGDFDTALRAGEESVELFRPLDDSVVKVGAGLFLGLALIEAGEVERGRAQLLHAAGGSELPLIGRVPRVFVYETLTRVELSRGRLDAADEWARRAEDASGSGELPIESGVARRARAAVLLASGDATCAADLALAAANDAADAGAPVESGRSRIVGGRALIQAGDKRRAIIELERAEAELAACGADGYRDEATAALRRLVHRSTRGAAGATHGIGSLTEREAEIAGLVSQGKTNREIATSCHLSEKTVERHLSHIFTKLGLRGRTALAALVSREHGSP